MVHILYINNNNNKKNDNSNKIIKGTIYFTIYFTMVERNKTLLLIFNTMTLNNHFFYFSMPYITFEQSLFLFWYTLPHFT